MQALNDVSGQLADNYLQARRQVPKVSNIAEGQVETHHCHRCHVEGHLAHNCPQKKMTSNEGARTPDVGTGLCDATAVESRATSPCTALKMLCISAKMDADDP